MKKTFAMMTAIILCIAMILGACGNSESASAPAANKETDRETAAPAADAGSQDQTQAPKTDDNQNENAAEDNESGFKSYVDWEDMAEIELYTFSFVAPNDVQHVEDAINEITEREINVQVHMHVLDIGSYIQQIGVMIAANERIDVMLDGFATAAYSSLMAQNQLMDISGYLEDYAPDTMANEMILQKMEGCKRGDGIYAIPRLGNIRGSINIVMRKDVLDDLGLTEKAENMTSTADYMEILEAVHNSEKWSYLRPYQMANGNGFFYTGYAVAGSFADALSYDLLGDDTGIIGVDENGKIFLQMETPQYQAAAAEAREMYEKGLLFFDITGDTVSMENLIMEDVLFSFVSTAAFDPIITYPSRCGMDMVVVPVVYQVIGTGDCTNWSWEIPVTAAEPAAAVAFINFAQTSPEINTLMAWGVEGVDYEVTDGVAHYIAGNEAPSFHMADYSVPNSFMVTPWDGFPADFNDAAIENMKGAEFSKYLGFTPDLSDCSTELAACANVINEYNLQVMSGQASEQVLQEYIDKMYSSGVQKIIDTYQTQLDAWLAGK